MTHLQEPHKPGKFAKIFNYALGGRLFVIVRLMLSWLLRCPKGEDRKYWKHGTTERVV